jgi:hypothetical protein
VQFEQDDSATPRQDEGFGQEEGEGFGSGQQEQRETRDNPADRDGQSRDSNRDGSDSNR